MLLLYLSYLNYGSHTGIADLYLLHFEREPVIRSSQDVGAAEHRPKRRRLWDSHSAMTIVQAELAVLQIEVTVPI